jgi:hypothetical protein
MGMIQYCDPDGLDTDGRSGSSKRIPRATPDFASAFQAGRSILCARGAVFPMTGSYTRQNGDLVTYATSGGFLMEVGTTSTLKRDRIYFGAYGKGARPIFDGGGVYDQGFIMASGVFMEDIQIQNIIRHLISIGGGISNVTIRRCLLRKQLNITNEGSGVFVRGQNVLIEMNTFDGLGADGVESDEATATNLIVRRNHHIMVGAKSLDGADAYILQASEGIIVEDNFVEKVSQQKQFSACSVANGDPAPTSPPIYRRNCFVGPVDGSGALSLVGNQTGAQVYSNLIISNRGIVFDQSFGVGRYPDGVEGWSNVLLGIPSIVRPNGSAATIDADGYADGTCFGGAKNELPETHAVSKFNNNFAYNFKRVMTTAFNVDVNEQHNNILVRMKDGAMAGQAHQNAANANISYDDGSTAAVYVAATFPNLWHDTDIEPTPASELYPLRQPGEFPLVNAHFGMSKRCDGYFYGDASQILGVDINGDAFVTEDTDARCNIGPTST